MPSPRWSGLQPPQGMSCPEHVASDGGARTCGGCLSSCWGDPLGWPEQLRETPYGEAKAALMEIRGVGAKIADCVCLFSLEKDEAVPVDTHIWAVAKEIFGCDIRTRTLTPSTYETVAGLFVQRYGSFAGWAQEYLYLQRRASQGRVRSVG